MTRIFLKFACDPASVRELTARVGARRHGAAAFLAARNASRCRSQRWHEALPMSPAPRHSRTHAPAAGLRGVRSESRAVTRRSPSCAWPRSSRSSSSPRPYVEASWSPSWESIETANGTKPTSSSSIGPRLGSCILHPSARATARRSPRSGRTKRPIATSWRCIAATAGASFSRSRRLSGGRAFVRSLAKAPSGAATVRTGAQNRTMRA